jgi:hypothetical protein
VLKRSIKPYQAYDIYLTKEQQLQGKVDWLVKDLEAWDVMCKWWMFEEFKTISLRNRQNRQSKTLVHNYGTDGHVHKTQKLVRYTFFSFRKFFVLTFL